VKPIIYLATTARSTCAILALLIPTDAVSLGDPPQQDTALVISVVEQFHKAIANSDAKAAMDLLAPDAVILESGSAETRDEYEKHHLAEDIAFSRAVSSKRSTMAVQIEGNVAWITSTSRATGTFKDQAVNSVGTELIVLTNSAAGWRIRAIHWSSHQVKRAE
jgi:ketosteroid isomerase-like protein